MKFYEFIYKTFARPVKWFYKAHVTGTENVPEEGGCLLCANHTSMHDVVVLAAALPRQPRYMAKKELFRIPLLAQLIRALGAFPVDRGGSDVSSIRKSIAMINGGEMVTMFPQGHRRRGVPARGSEVKSGAGLLAYRTGAPVLPVYIGTAKYQVKPFRRTDIIIGKPIPNSELGFENGGSAEYTRASQIIFDAICDLGEGAVGSDKAGVSGAVGADTTGAPDSADAPETLSDAPDTANTSRADGGSAGGTE